MDKGEGKSDKEGISSYGMLFLLLKTSIYTNSILLLMNQLCVSDDAHDPNHQQR